MTPNAVIPSMDHFVGLFTDFLVLVGQSAGVSILGLAVFYFIVTARADKEG